MCFFLPKQFSMEIIYYSTHGIVGDCKLPRTDLKYEQWSMKVI